MRNNPKLMLSMLPDSDPTSANSEQSGSVFARKNRVFDKIYQA